MNNVPDVFRPLLDAICPPERVVSVPCPICEGQVSVPGSSAACPRCYPDEREPGAARKPFCEECGGTVMHRRNCPRNHGTGQSA